MSGPAEIRHLADADGAIRDGIGNLWPQGVVDETPRGRLNGIDRDTWLTYREMYALLTGQTPVSGVGEYEMRLGELAEQLADLHGRAERAFEDFMQALDDERPCG